MEKTENKKYSKTSWIVFIFTISIVLISLVPVIFPALFSEILFKTELNQFDIPKSYSLEPFELGGLAVPLIITNIIVFSLFWESHFCIYWHSLGSKKYFYYDSKPKSS